MDENTVTVNFDNLTDNEREQFLDFMKKYLFEVNENINEKTR